MSEANESFSYNQHLKETVKLFILTMVNTKLSYCRLHFHHCNLLYNSEEITKMSNIWHWKSEDYRSYHWWSFSRLWLFDREWYERFQRVFGFINAEESWVSVGKSSWLWCRHRSCDIAFPLAVLLVIVFFLLAIPVA